tara:strand:- start:493 stop:1026 length:534 start_codon:yes stop_codon:yes gene_type:complete
MNNASPNCDHKKLWCPYADFADKKIKQIEAENAALREQLAEANKALGTLKIENTKMVWELAALRQQLAAAERDKELAVGDAVRGCAVILHSRWYIGADIQEIVDTMLKLSPAAIVRQAEEYKRDAERYRWLRNDSFKQFVHPIVVSQTHTERGVNYIGPVFYESLDAAIDAAKEEGK